MMKKNVFILFHLLVVGLVSINGQPPQQSVASSGGDASNTEGSVSYSVGQDIYSGSQSESGEVSEGIQQPYEIFVLTGLDVKGVNLKFSIYPNPTSDILILETEFEEQDLTYQLYDINGKILQNNNIVNDQTKIDLSEYNTSVYLLIVRVNNEELKSFKIIKK